MSARVHHLTTASAVDSRDLTAGWSALLTPTATMLAPLPRRDIPARAPTSAKRRTQIWELHNSLHCSIIGTCLTNADLRRLLVRLEVHGVDAADEHELHTLGVMLASRSQAGAKHLQKALDRVHKTAINQFAKAKDTGAVSALWQDALTRGDIPGAYWALLTHPATTDSVVKQAFGKVHMLSHLVGAANRADIRRLRQLEEANAALSETIERQQRQLRDGFTARDAAIRRLNNALAQKAIAEAATAPAGEARALADALADREKRLVEEVSRRERLAQRLERTIAERDEAERSRQSAERDASGLAAELAAIEQQVGALLPGEQEPTDTIDLRGRCLLYVGGRAHQIPRLKALVERGGGGFVHHDGGLEHNGALLPGLVSRADLVAFPVDCISHEAAGAIKRACRQLDKRYLPLRTSSLTCLLSGLATIPAEPEPAPIFDPS